MEEKKYKMNRKLTEFKCCYCGEVATKPTSEFNRNAKLNRNNFCSRSCSIIWGNKNRPKESFKSEKSLEHLRSIGTKRDEYTPFRYTLRNAKKRFKEFNIDLQYLKEIWEKQNGRCVYTNIELKLPEYRDTLKNDPNIRASLDRIDSSKGYIKGNVQFISTSINYLKNTMSNDDTNSFLKLISNNLSLDKDQTISSSQNEMLDANSGN